MDITPCIKQELELAADSKGDLLSSEPVQQPGLTKHHDDADNAPHTCSQHGIEQLNSQNSSQPQIEALLKLIQDHPDSEAAITAALRAVQRLKRSAPAGSQSTQNGGVTKRAATSNHGSGSAESLHESQDGRGEDDDDGAVSDACNSELRQAHADQSTGGDVDVTSQHGPSTSQPTGAELEVCQARNASSTGGSTADGGDVTDVPSPTTNAAAAASVQAKNKKARARSELDSPTPSGQALLGADVLGNANKVAKLSISGAVTAHATAATGEATTHCTSQGQQQPQALSSVPEQPEDVIPGDVAVETTTSSAVKAEAAGTVTTQVMGTPAPQNVPEMNTYLEMYPMCKQLVEAVRTTPNNSTKTPLAVVNEYAARLTYEVCWEESSDSPVGPYTAKCILQDRRKQVENATGTGRGRNKRDARQVAAAACLEGMLIAGITMIADFMPQAKPSIPMRRDLKPGLGFNPPTGGGHIPMTRDTRYGNSRGDWQPSSKKRRDEPGPMTSSLSAGGPSGGAAAAAAGGANNPMRPVAFTRAVLPSSLPTAYNRNQAEILPSPRAPMGPMVRATPQDRTRPMTNDRTRKLGRGPGGIATTYTQQQGSVSPDTAGVSSAHTAAIGSRYGAAAAAATSQQQQDGASFGMQSLQAILPATADMPNSNKGEKRDFATAMAYAGGGHGNDLNANDGLLSPGSALDMSGLQGSLPLDATLHAAAAAAAAAAVASQLANSSSMLQEANALHAAAYQLMVNNMNSVNAQAALDAAAASLTGSLGTQHASHALPGLPYGGSPSFPGGNAYLPYAGSQLANAAAGLTANSQHAALRAQHAQHIDSLYAHQPGLSASGPAKPGYHSNDYNPFAPTPSQPPSTSYSQHGQQAYGPAPTHMHQDGLSLGRASYPSSAMTHQNEPGRSFTSATAAQTNTGVGAPSTLPAAFGGSVNTTHSGAGTAAQGDATIGSSSQVPMRMFSERAGTQQGSVAPGSIAIPGVGGASGGLFGGLGTGGGAGLSSQEPSQSQSQGQQSTGWSPWGWNSLGR